MLTVETEVNGDLKSTYKRGPSLVGSLGSSSRYKRLLYYFGYSSRPNTNNLAQQPGQAVVQGRPVSECVSPGGPKR